MCKETARKRKARPGLEADNPPQGGEGGGGEHLHGQHHQGGGGGGDGGVQSLKSKWAIKQQAKVDIFVKNINKYKEDSKVKQLVNDFEVEGWRTRSRVTRAVVEEQSGCSSPHKRIKMPEVRPPPNAPSTPGPRTMRPSPSCPSPPRTRPSTCARPRRRGPKIPSTPITFAIPPPAAETHHQNLGMVNTVSRWTACTARSMGTWPPTSSTPTSLQCSGTSGSKEEHPRIHLPPANPSARPFGKGTCSASSSSSKCLDSEKRKRVKSIPESMGDMQSTTSSSSPSVAYKKRQAGDDPARKILSSSFSPSPKPEEAEDKQEERKSRKEKIRKIQEDSITSSERNDYFAVENVETNLRKPGLEAEPGTTGPPPSRACSSPGSSSPSGVMTPSPRCSRTGDKGGRGALYGNGRK